MILSHIWRGHGTAIFLEFGKLAERLRQDGTPGNPYGEISIMIEWSWRIEGEKAIVCGSWSDEDLWQSTFDELLGSKVLKFAIFGRLPEIEFVLDSGYRFLSFATSDGHPEWAIIDNRNTEKYSIFSENGELVKEG